VPSQGLTASTQGSLRVGVRVIPLAAAVGDV
jgi:hypothetical protein